MEKAQISKVRNFQRQAQEALNSGDAEGAKTLATKAKVIAGRSGEVGAFCKFSFSRVSVFGFGGLIGTGGVNADSGWTGDVGFSPCCGEMVVFWVLWREQATCKGSGMVVEKGRTGVVRGYLRDPSLRSG